MQIRIRTTGQVLLEHEWIKWVAMTYAKSISVLTPEVFDMFDSDPVFDGPQATGGTVYQYSQRDGVEQLEDGKWYTKYILAPVFTDNDEGTAAEHEAVYKAIKDAERATAVREERNRRIGGLDWTQGKDIPDAISGPAALVRQALRDVPNQEGFPWSVVWPENPTP